MSTEVQDNAAWVKQHFADCPLGDKRRVARLQTMASNMLQFPDQSLPRQNQLWKDIKAAYRLLNHPAVTFEAVCHTHWLQTRSTPQGEYLFICDTTDLDFTKHKATSGLGMLGNGRGRGTQLHSCLVVNAETELIVGVAGALLRNRSRSKKGETRKERLERYRESQLWGDLVDQIGPPPPGSRWIYVFDRAGDHFEAYLHLRQQGADWVVRAAQLHRRVIAENGENMPLEQVLSEAPVVGTYELERPRRGSVKARTAHLEVSITSIKMPRPAHHSPWVKSTGIIEIPMHVVQVQEVDAPQGVTPIRWVLLTSRPVETFNDALRVIDGYTSRWLIEEYHKVLKTGCRVERHALQTLDRLRPLIGLISVVGVRLLQLKLIGRKQPEVKAEDCVPREHLQVLQLAFPSLDLGSLTVYDFFRRLAQLGGFLARRGDGEPGWQTIWQGYQRLTAWLEGIRLVGGLPVEADPPHQ